MPPKARLLIYTGRFAPEKNLDTLVAAVRRLGPDYWLLAVGSGTAAPRGDRVIVWPQIISKSTNRLVNYQTYFEKEMPFRFADYKREIKKLTAEYTQILPIVLIDMRVWKVAQSASGELDHLATHVDGMNLAKELG